jgi:hypothetical protein
MRRLHADLGGDAGEHEVRDAAPLQDSPSGVA